MRKKRSMACRERVWRRSSGASSHLQGPQGCTPTMPTNWLTRLVHSRGDGLSSPWGGVVTLLGLSGNKNPSSAQLATVECVNCIQSRIERIYGCVQTYFTLGRQRHQLVQVVVRSDEVTDEV